MDIRIHRRMHPTPVSYTHLSYTKGDAKRGNLNWGLTVLHPLCVAGECNMTRGHWHEAVSYTHLDVYKRLMLNDLQKGKK